MQPLAAGMHASQAKRRSRPAAAAPSRYKVRPVCRHIYTGDERLKAVANSGQRGTREAGEIQSAVQALEQLYAEVTLQRVDLVADRRRGDMQLGGRFLKVQMTRRRLKCTQSA